VPKRNAALGEKEPLLRSTLPLLEGKKESVRGRGRKAENQKKSAGGGGTANGLPESVAKDNEEKKEKGDREKKKKLFLEQ